MKTQRIDFVITWIKDNDLNWLNEKSKYLSENTRQLRQAIPELGAFALLVSRGGKVCTLGS